MLCFIAAILSFILAKTCNSFGKMRDF
jgi:hypothetical protein